MIGVERLQKVLAVVGASASVKNGSGPISVNLIAPSDAGKTQLILSAQPPNARVLNDFTTASLLRLLDTQKPPTFLIVPDLNTVISHKPAVATLTMAFLLSLLAEGVTEIPGVDEAVKLKAKNLKARGVRVALITGMTPEMFHTKRGAWRKTGFLRRLVPIHFAYSDETLAKIQDSIQNGSDSLAYRHQVQRPPARRDIELPKKIEEGIRRLSEQVTERQLIWTARTKDGLERIQQAHEYPFSAHKTLRQFTRAAALLDNRRTAQQKDLTTVRDIVRFMRYDRPEEI